MANKPPKQHKCKECGSYYIKFQSTQQVCSVKCAMAMGKRKTEAKRKKSAKIDRLEQRKRLEKLKSRRDFEKDLQKIFNKFIRLRDKDLPCISCGRYHQGNMMQGIIKPLVVILSYVLMKIIATVNVCRVTDICTAIL